MVAPTYEDPNPNMLCEWAENNQESSGRMLAILIKYADIDRQNILEEIAQIMEMLDKEANQEPIEKFKSEMRDHLWKMETTIKERKAQKFLRNKNDYERGQIYTFAKKFENLRRQTMNTKGQGAPEAQSELSSIQTLKVDIDLEEGPSRSSTPAVPSVIDEFGFLQQKRRFNLRPRPPVSSEGPLRGRGRGSRGAKGPNNSNVTNKKKN